MHGTFVPKNFTVTHFTFVVNSSFVCNCNLWYIIEKIHSSSVCVCTCVCVRVCVLPTAQNKFVIGEKYVYGLRVVTSSGKR
jgi:hypothetical protein